MSILALLPVLIFGFSGVFALAVLAVSARQAFAAWGELARALGNCTEVRSATITVFDTGSAPVRPPLRLVEGGIRPRTAPLPRGLRAAA